MIPEKMNDVLRHEGVVAIVSQGTGEPHVVNTWNSYLTVFDNQKLLIPVGGMRVTEQNVVANPNVLLTLGSRQVQGFNSLGTGFLIKGTAKFMQVGPEFDLMKQRFAWIRAVLVVSPQTITQTL